MNQEQRNRLVVLRKAQKWLITQAEGDACVVHGLEGRGKGQDAKIYLIYMIDDATGKLAARFLREYLETHGRPMAFYADKASSRRWSRPRLARHRPILTSS